MNAHQILLALIITLNVRFLLIASDVPAIPNIRSHVVKLP